MAAPRKTFTLIGGGANPPIFTDSSKSTAAAVALGKIEKMLQLERIYKTLERKKLLRNSEKWRKSKEVNLRNGFSYKNKLF